MFIRNLRKCPRESQMKNYEDKKVFDDLEGLAVSTVGNVVQFPGSIW